MAKLLKKPNVMIEKRSMGMNIVERAKAPTEKVKPIDTAVRARPMTIGPVTMMEAEGDGTIDADRSDMHAVTLPMIAPSPRSAKPDSITVCSGMSS